MNIKLISQNSENGKMFDISTLVSGIQHSTSMYGQPGKLILNLEEDPNKILELSPGSVLSLVIDGREIFYGYIFVMGTDATGVYKITAYDQMRYLKNEETIVTYGVTASQAFSDLCVMHGLKYRIVSPSSFIPEAYYHDRKTLFSIMERMIQLSNISEGRSYFIRDKFGTLEFTSIDRLKSNLVLGDGSLLTSYQYEISIDKNTYNTIKVVRDNEESGRRDVWIEYDSGNQKRWGKLQKTDTASQDMNEAEIRARAADLLKYYNTPEKTMKLTAVGAPNVDTTVLTAGSGFMLKLEKLGISEYMWITSAVHTYQDELHTMALDVFI